MRRMSRNRTRFSGMLTVLLVLAAFPVVAAAQSPAPTGEVFAAAALQMPAPDRPTGDHTATQTAVKPAIISPFDQRQLQILADTNRLLQLAQELKVEVSKSNKDILSFAVVKKADAIEKLAKNLKERMRTE